MYNNYQYYDYNNYYPNYNNYYHQYQQGPHKKKRIHMFHSSLLFFKRFFSFSKPISREEFWNEIPTLIILWLIIRYLGIYFSLKTVNEYNTWCNITDFFIIMYMIMVFGSIALIFRRKSDCPSKQKQELNGLNEHDSDVPSVSIGGSKSIFTKIMDVQIAWKAMCIVLLLIMIPAIFAWYICRLIISYPALNTYELIVIGIYLLSAIIIGLEPTKQHVL